VTEDHGEQAFRVGTGSRELVSVANAGRAQFDQHFAGARAIEVDGFDHQRLTGLVTDGGTGLHAGGSCGSLLWRGAIPHAVEAYTGDIRPRRRESPKVGDNYGF
jgi:hypothetical protein